jgi:hypothetical protein
VRGGSSSAIALSLSPLKRQKTRRKRTIGIWEAIGSGTSRR